MYTDTQDLFRLHESTVGPAQSYCALPCNVCRNDFAGLQYIVCEFLSKLEEFLPAFHTTSEFIFA
jgi:hypothetical protein